MQKILVSIVCLIALTACSSISTQTVQTTHFNFSIPSYRQTSADAQRQDTRSDKTGSLIVEYAQIQNSNDFANLIQSNISTLRQNISTQLQDDIVSTDIQIPCSGDVATGNIISFQTQQDEDLLYFSQIFTIYQQDITVISIASFANDIRSETIKKITDTITCNI